MVFYDYIKEFTYFFKHRLNLTILHINELKNHHLFQNSKKYMNKNQKIEFNLNFIH